MKVKLTLGGQFFYAISFKKRVQIRLN